jgi:NO-binding membrane sensor protein with MHYT domain
MVITGTYDPYLVALSILVATFASYTALDLGGRVAPAQGCIGRSARHRAGFWPGSETGEL